MEQRLFSKFLIEWILSLFDRFDMDREEHIQLLETTTTSNNDDAVRIRSNSEPITRDFAVVQFMPTNSAAIHVS